MPNPEPTEVILADDSDSDAEIIAPVTNADDDGTASQTADTDEGGPTVASLVSRLKASGVSANDLEQVERYRGGWESEKELRGRLSEFESDEYKETAAADVFMRDVVDDPELLATHQAFRDDWGDKAYVKECKRVSRELAKTQGEEGDTEKLLKRMERLEGTLRERTEAESKRQRVETFQKDLTQIMAGLKLPNDDAKEFLREDISNTADGIRNSVELAAHAKKRYDKLKKLLSSASKTGSTRKPIEPELPPPSKTDEVESTDADERGGFIRTIMRRSSKKALSMNEVGSGAG
jgi:DNA repair exonuclease SbcCD ATPase subunit